MALIDTLPRLSFRKSRPHKIKPRSDLYSRQWWEWDCSWVHLSVVNILPLVAVVWGDVCLTVNRLIAVLLPHQYRFFTIPHIICSMIICSWAMAFVVSLPGAFNVGLYYTVLNDGASADRITGTAGVVWLSLGTWTPNMLVWLWVLWIGVVKKKCSRQAQVPSSTGNIAMPPSNATFE